MLLVLEKLNFKILNKDKKEYFIKFLIEDQSLYSEV